MLTRSTTKHAYALSSNVQCQRTVSEAAISTRSVYVAKTKNTGVTISSCLPYRDVLLQLDSYGPRELRSLSLGSPVTYHAPNAHHRIARSPNTLPPASDAQDKGRPNLTPTAVHWKEGYLRRGFADPCSGVEPR